MSRFIVFGAKIVDSNNRYNCSNEFLDQGRIFQFVTGSENNDFRDSGKKGTGRVNRSSFLAVIRARSGSGGGPGPLFTRY